jgi:hypothetical protein
MHTGWSAGGRALHVLAFVAALAALLIFVPAASAQLEDAYIEGSLSGDTVFGPGFTPYATVTVVVKDAPGGTVLYSASALVDAFGWFEAVPGVDLVPGMYISVSEGLATRELILAALSIDAISPAENTVTGTAPPSSTFWVDAGVGDETPGLEVTSDTNGDWTADFDDVGVDITPYTHIGAAVGDEDGDQTSFDLQLMELPAFEVHRYVNSTLMYLTCWTAGETLALTIEDPTTPASPDYETSIVAEAFPADEDGFARWIDYVVRPGDVVTVTDGATTKSHTVTDIAVTEVDAAADVVRGTAAPGSELWVYAPGNYRWTSAAGDGAWMIDFSVSDDPGQAVLDILPGTSGSADQGDADGDSTVVEWYVPRPEGWQHNPATGHDYLFVEDGMSWADAEAYAVSLGGHLVTVNDAAENDWLIATLGTEYYIGMNDRAIEGTWVWASGEPVTFTGWFDGEPNDYQGQDAAVIWNKPPVGWDDVSDSWNQFVVEVVPIPTLTSFTPASGPVGTSVTVTGTGFTGATKVTFNGTAATSFSVPSATQIAATVPSGATSGTLAVTTPGGTATSAASFTVTTPPPPPPPPSVTPTVASFSPTSGPVSTLVTLTGTGFSGATKVTFNGTAATSFSVASATQITATVPAGASSGPIAVITAAGTGASAASFTVTAPPPPVFTPTVTLKLTGLTNGAVKLGKSMTAKGKVTPTSLAGSKVTLTVQRKHGTKWLKLKSTGRTISATGSYSWKYEPARKGAYRIKATIAKTAEHLAAGTTWRTFRVR